MQIFSPAWLLEGARSGRTNKKARSLIRVALRRLCGAANAVSLLNYRLTGVFIAGWQLQTAAREVKHQNQLEKLDFQLNHH